MAGVLGCPCLRVRAPHVPRPCWLRRAVRVCVLRLGFWLRHTTPGWGVRVCVCLCAYSACTPPLLAGVSGCVCVCVCALLVPRHCWLGRMVWLCVFGLGFWLRPGIPGWVSGVCVCLCVRSACTPPLVAGVSGCVSVCVRDPLVPRHGWLGRAVWVCVLGLGFWLRPATPGCGVGLCVCLCARSACTSPLLAGACGLGLCAWARVLAAPRHSWLGCLGVCVFVCALRLYPVSPGSGVRCGCVCLGSGFRCALQLLSGVLGYVCVCVCAPLVPRHSWLGYAVWVCVLELGFPLCPATPRWGIGVCVCLCARSSCTSIPRWSFGLFFCLCARFFCTPLLLAGVCGVGVCAWAQPLAAPRSSWLGCWGVCVIAPLVPRLSWLGRAV